MEVLQEEGVFKGQSRGQLSRLEDVVFNDFIPDGDGQVSSGSASLPDPVALETVEQTLEREQNGSDVLEALGEYKSYDGISDENVPAVVNIKTLKGRFIAHKFSTGWSVGVVKSLEKKKSVVVQFEVKCEHCCVCLTDLTAEICN